MKKLLLICLVLIAHSFTYATAPVNDEPCNAILLVADSTCNYVTYTNTGATNTLGITNPGCGNYSGGDVWFKVVVPSSGALNISTQSIVMFDGSMAAYTGNCNALTLDSCSDDVGANLMPSLYLSGLTTNDTVWIRIFSNSNSSNGTFGICVEIATPFIPPPLGQGVLCINAIPFCSSTPVTFQNSIGIPSMGSMGVYGCLGSTPNPMWFVIKAAVSSMINVTATQTNIMGNNCDVDLIGWGPFTSIANTCSGISSTNIIGCNYSAGFGNIQFNTQAGMYYLLMATNFSNQHGNITLSATPGALDCAGLIIASATSTSINCYGDSSGTASGSVAGGIGPFGYEWTGANSFTANGMNISNLLAGTYTLTVTDSSDMSTATATTTITQPNAITTNQTVSICAGSSINIGTNTYSTPGVYLDILITTNGCDSSVTTNLTVLPYDATFNYGTNIYCIGGPNPVPVVNGSGGIFSAIPSGMIINSATGEIDLSGTLAGIYTVTCTSGTCSYNASITISAQPDASFTYTGSPYCQSEINPSPLFSIGAVAGTFSSSPFPGLVFTNLSGEVGLSFSMPGSYVITNTIPAMGGCSAVVATANIIIDFAIPANFTIVPDSTNGFSYWTFVANSGVGNYSWNFDDGSGINNAASPTHTYSSSGPYDVSLVVTSGGCVDSTHHLIMVTGISNPCLSLFNVAHSTSSANPNAYTLTNLSYGSNLTYLWSFGDTTTSTLQLPTHTYSSTGPYQICLTVDNGAGCSQTFCDSLFSVDSLGHSMLQPISIDVVDGPSPSITTAINETKSVTESVIIYPNPAHECITISAKYKVHSIKMYDVIGKEIKNWELGIRNEKSVTLDMSGFAKGIYFVQIQTDKETVNRKIVVQ